MCVSMRIALHTRTHRKRERYRMREENKENYINWKDTLKNTATNITHTHTRAWALTSREEDQEKNNKNKIKKLLTYQRK